MQIDGFRPIRSRYNAPIPVPHGEPDATPGSPLTLSCEWWSYVLGAVGHMQDQGVWDTNDPAEMELVMHRVDQLRWLISQAANTGDCFGDDISCVYDFTESQANPWIATPSLPTDPQTTWSILGLGWTGANSAENPEFWAQVGIQADYIPFVVNTFEVFYGGPPAPCCGENWAIRFYDHGLNLLAEVLDSGGSTVGFAGPLANVCRIMVNRRADSFAGTLQPTIQKIEMTGLSFTDACEQLVPLADPPSGGEPSTWCYKFDFTESTSGWTTYSGESSAAIYTTGEGWQHGPAVQWIPVAPVHVTSIEFDYSVISDAAGDSGTSMYNGALTVLYVTEAPLGGVGDHHVVSGPLSVDITELVLLMSSGGAGTGLQYWRSVTLRGNGSNPFGENNC